MDMETKANIKDALFTTPLLKVLDFLLQHSEAELIDTEIAALVDGVEKSAVNLALRKLAELGITNRRPRGSMVFNSLIESPLTLRFKMVSNLMAIQPLMDRMIPLCSKIVLFGSRADGTNTSESDFDILAVTSKEDAARKIVHKSPLAESIQLLVKTPEQMLTFDEDEPVLAEETGKGIVLWEKK